ncbi:glycoside hydrolase family 2 protein [Bacteroidota bacterium]
MNIFSRCVWIVMIFLSIRFQVHSQTQIPLPEHPRPDFMRSEWINLNGDWDFEFDIDDVGISKGWYKGKSKFTKQILVPFSWGSPLSGVENEAEIGWYDRSITFPLEWQGKRIILVIGACDWQTDCWLDGKQIGTHKGGYTPFEFDLTEYIKYGKEQRLVLRVDDAPHEFKLYGKQGYGEAKGIWQTLYLEARNEIHFDHIHFTPDIDNNKVSVSGEINTNLTSGSTVEVTISGKEKENVAEKFELRHGEKDFRFDISIPNPHLWNLDDPYLYNVEASLKDKNGIRDLVQSYFGMRKVGVINLPGTDHAYVSLNDKPVYLQLALDQAFHPEGFYTFPSDAFVRDEIIRSKKIGLNGQRVHVKITVPRKLYWADKLGVLIMADVPNSWGQPDENMRTETEYALRQMIKRDYNHPSIFSWVIFNETWGLFSRTDDGRKYLPETQKWVIEIYELAQELDPTRLVEDNSPCNYDHVVTDMNTWHAYLPGYQWNEFLTNMTDKSYPGSGYNYVEGYRQGNQPLINSECGNVWGYKGSTGDVDWSWDYHIMINEFRKKPKIAGWLYTEHHDVINEWNGYYKYDRSEKFTGLGEIVPGMTLNDLHSPVYLSPGTEQCTDVEPGSKITVPLWLSIMTEHFEEGKYIVESKLYGWDAFGNEFENDILINEFNLNPWQNEEIGELEVVIPSFNGLGIFCFILKNQTGTVLHRNFVAFVFDNDKTPKQSICELNGSRYWSTSWAPATYSDAEWSEKKWSAQQGNKVNGAGFGHYTYTLELPEGLDAGNIESGKLRMEISSKKLMGKDREDLAQGPADYMRGGGLHDPSKNSNSYPMTDTYKFPSNVRVFINDVQAGEYFLQDDPADHRGILSWHSQERNGTLDEAGTYGYLTDIIIPYSAIEKAFNGNAIHIRLEVDKSLPGGMAIYGKKSGRYPVDPMLLFKLKN